MRISELQLQNRANVYIKNKVLMKIRGTGIPQRQRELFDLLRKDEKPLTLIELEHLRQFNDVIIEEDDYVEFINFTGASHKIKPEPFRKDGKPASLSNSTVSELAMDLQHHLINAATIREDMSVSEYLNNYFKQ